MIVYPKPYSIYILEGDFFFVCGRGGGSIKKATTYTKKEIHRSPWVGFGASGSD